MVEVVAAILINSEGKILIARRMKDKHMGGFWEFPGGKIEQGETPENALIRELKEEMNVDIKLNSYFGENIYDYGDIIIKLIVHIGKIVCGDIKLHDHEQYKWVNKQELVGFEFSQADMFFARKLETNM